MHSIHTENGLTPLQLWSRGTLSATPQIQKEIAEGLAIDADYGVEIGEQSHTNIFDSESVVQEIDVGLCDQQLEYIYMITTTLYREVTVMVLMFT